MLGASVYISEDIKEIYQYLDKMKKYGASTVFTSFHILEDDNNEAINKIKLISEKANKNNLKLIVDISTNTLEKYEMSLDEMIKFFSSIKVSSLRLDYGFNFFEIKQLSKHFNIVFNASIIDEEFCENLINQGLSLKEITVCHNFYPRPDTGLSKKFILKKNKFLRSKGFKIQAFIPGDEKKRGPIFEGLPTIEKHRKIDPFISYTELIIDLYVDEVIVGDISIKEETLNRINLFETQKIIELRINDLVELSDEVSNVFWMVHKNREDHSEYVIRSTSSRLTIREKIEPLNNIERLKGSITIDNKNYLRYNGEIQICMVDLEKDERVNVIGKIYSEDIYLLKYIVDDVKFKFVNFQFKNDRDS